MKKLVALAGLLVTSVFISGATAAENLQLPADQAQRAVAPAELQRVPVKIELNSVAPARIPGSITRTGQMMKGLDSLPSAAGFRSREKDAIVLEELSVKLDLQATKIKFGDLELKEVMKRLLEQNGIPVNGLHFDPAKLSQRLGKAGKVDCYHVIHPPAEKSNTICL